MLLNHLKKTLMQFLIHKTIPIYSSQYIAEELTHSSLDQYQKQNLSAPCYSSEVFQNF